MSAKLNCDMGEGMANDAMIMPFIHAANIACGYHAGDTDSMKHTIELCLEHGVDIGAHPSFLDRENFGRKEMDIPVQELYEIIIQQLLLINDMTHALGGQLKHVKPHGALYNLSARDVITARIVARAVVDFNPELVLVGLSGSHSITEAKELGLATASEVFADRSYQEDGSLTPRSQPDALISDTRQAIAQVLQMIQQGTVTSTSGVVIPVQADTICIHGDGPDAVIFAKAIREALNNV